MKILLTGFDPFGGEKINPAYEAVKLLPDQVSGAEVVKIEVPTVFEKDGDVLDRAIQEHKPDAIICIGQAGGYAGLAVEKVAINLIEARIPDNEGKQPFDAKIFDDGDTAYFATIPVKTIVKRIKESGIPAVVSYSAGTFVCNDLMYRLLYLINKKYPTIKGGFIHVPYLPVQTVDLEEGTPSMSAETIAAALECAVKTIATGDDESCGPMGNIF